MSKIDVNSVEYRRNMLETARQANYWTAKDKEMRATYRANGGESFAIPEGKATVIDDIPLHQYDLDKIRPHISDYLYREITVRVLDVKALDYHVSKGNIPEHVRVGADKHAKRSGHVKCSTN